MNPLAGQVPDDPSELAKIFADHRRTQEELRRAFDQLLPCLLQVARRLLRLWNVRDASQADDLVAHVALQLIQGHYDQSRGPLLPWAKVVMSRALASMLRRAHAAQFVPDFDTPYPRADWLQRESDVDLCETFSVGDLDRVRSWKSPQQRIVLLCRSLLWRKVPPAEWDAFLIQGGVAPPFPPEGFADLSSIEQNGGLAQALRVTRNRMLQYWYRGQLELLELDFVRGLHT